MIGCNCRVCSSADPRDRRLRASAFVEYGGLSILIDCGPDFRYQMLRSGISHIDAILLTHNHLDHTGGLDDTRSFNLIESKPVNIYCEEYVENALRKQFSYAFAEPRYPGSPEWHMHRIDASSPFEVYSNEGEDTLVWESGYGYHKLKADGPDTKGPVSVIPIQGWHDAFRKNSVLGYRFGDIAYITDIKTIDEEEMEKLKGVKAITVNCVKKEPHHSHLSLPEALQFFEKVGADNSYITHISHRLPPHSILEKELPSGVHLAYDGLVIESGE